MIKSQLRTRPRMHSWLAGRSDSMPFDVKLHIYLVSTNRVKHWHSSTGRDVNSPSSRSRPHARGILQPWRRDGPTRYLTQLGERAVGKHHRSKLQSRLIPYHMRTALKTIRSFDVNSAAVVKSSV